MPVSVLLMNLEDSINNEQLSSRYTADPFPETCLFPINVQSVTVALFFLTAIQPECTVLLMKVKPSTSNLFV